MTKSAIRIENAVIVTMNRDFDIVKGGILVSDGRIQCVGKLPKDPQGRTLDASGMVVIPGLVQTHVHLCQTLFRNMAEDLNLLNWLKLRIWPMEAAHNGNSLSVSALLGIAELIRGGTTTILDMGTVHHTSVIFQALLETGLRGYSGKAMMDIPDGLPSSLCESKDESLAESIRLFDRWHGKAYGRIKYAFSPRFTLCSSGTLIEEAADEARSRGTIFHTHASETLSECKVLRKREGVNTIEYLDKMDALGSNVCLAHCVHINRSEMSLLAKTGTHVCHCPGTNLKLGSGIAKVPEMLKMGISVSLAADGPACNNNLDIFHEMRLAGLIQRSRLGPEAMPAREILRMATLGGAGALGLGDEIGSIEVGKKGDLVLLDLCKPHCLPAEDPYTQIVYSAKSSDVHTTMVDGRILMEDRKLTTIDEEKILRSVPGTLEALLRRSEKETRGC